MYHTGDTAYMDDDGYYWYVGRTDDLIKASGYRIGPFEIESILMEHPSVLECAITAADDAIRGKVVKATIVLAKGYTASPELAKELQNYVKQSTAPYKYPRIVEFGCCAFCLLLRPYGILQDILFCNFQHFIFFCKSIDKYLALWYYIILP